VAAFQSPVGLAEFGRVKTLQHTNMYMSGCLPSPWAMYFKNLSAVFVRDGRSIWTA
jgi:hypothetical protein